MAIYKGSSKIDELYLGSTKIDKVYKGSTLLYQAVKGVQIWGFESGVGLLGSYDTNGLVAISDPTQTSVITAINGTLGAAGSDVTFDSSYSGQQRTVTAYYDSVYTFGDYTVYHYKVDWSTLIWHFYVLAGSEVGSIAIGLYLSPSGSIVPVSVDNYEMVVEVSSGRQNTYSRLPLMDAYWTVNGLISI